MNDNIVYAITFGFAGGVLAASLAGLPSFTAIVPVIAAIALVLLTALSVVPKKPALIGTLALLSLGGGIMRFEMRDAAHHPELLSKFVGTSVSIVGIIDTEVEDRASSQRFMITSREITEGGVSYDVETRILVSTERFPVFSYGDEVEVSGELARPESFVTDTGREFDYAAYLRKDGVFYTISFSDVILISQNNGSLVKRHLLRFKEKFLSSIEHLIPAPQSSLLSGLLLGVRESLGSNLENAFIATGLIHIVVLSGYNVTIVAEAIVKMLSFVSITFGTYVGAASVALFALIAGGGASIVRASIMAIIALSARTLGRGYDVGRALMLAGVGMVYHNPHILVFDISFQLSFIATIGIVYFSPLFEKTFSFLPERFGIREVAVSSIGVQIFVLPFLLWKIGTLSIIAPISNILVLPFVPPTMLFGFLAGAVGLVIDIVGIPFAFVAHLLLSYIISAVELFSSIPLASVIIAKFPLTLVIISYVVFVFLMKRFYERRAQTLA